VSKGPAGSDEGSDDDLAARLEALRGELSVAKAGLGRSAEGEPAAGSRRRRRWAGAAVVGVVAAAGAAAGELAAAGGGHRPAVKAPGLSPTQPASPTSAGAAPPPSSPATTLLPNPTTTLPLRPGPPAPARAAPAPPSTAVVQAGQSFWTIAESVLRQRLGRAPGEAEVAAYWARLVAANYSRLVVAGDPNLIYSGQVLVLPAG
jgi:hypothetical protein